MSPTPRVRMAPAPSGWLHVGSVRTALYNWLYARKHGGAFVLRIEDTDKERATDESMRSMLEGFRLLGLDWDEGPEVGGAHGPYRQSERIELFRVVARHLDDAGHTWRDQRTPDELEAWRTERRSLGLAPTIKASNSDAPEDPLDERPYVLRLRLPDEGELVVDDLVRGEVRWDWANVADPVLVRSDGSATYPLANTTDDLAQGMTLICRGEDLLSATPFQVHLHRVLRGDGLIDAALEEVGFPAREPDWEPPSAFAHLSMIVGPDRKKLSKRHGSVAVQELIAKGYLPETLVNYLALLGWAPGDGRERLELDEMIAAFDFDRVSKPAAMFDEDKLTAFNGERIRDLPADELSRRLMPYLDGTYGEPLIRSEAATEDREIVRGLVPLVQERMQRLDEVQRYAPAFLAEELDHDQDSVEKFLRTEDAGRVLAAAEDVLVEVQAWTATAIEEALRALPERLGLGARKVFQPIRVAATGSSVSPPLFESLELIGRDRALRRLAHARATFV
ncbi:MAG: glutamate--tRNA ligase [Actinobacteria bacterium]|nr:glutamate--tRNA ligase [Actinomycetota bacterium]